jgi:hypothetical protein
MKNHASSKHGKANYEECFEGAEAHAKALAEKVSKGGSAGGEDGRPRSKTSQDLRESVCGGVSP